MTVPWYGAAPPPLDMRRTLPAVQEELARVHDGEYARVVPTTLSLRPVMLPRSSYDELVAAAGALLRLLRRTLLERAPSAAGRIAALGADEGAYPLVMPGRVEEDYATCIARPDVMVDATGPKFVEFNIGSGIGGVVDTALHTAAWAAAFGGTGRMPFHAVDPLAVRDDLFVRAVRDLGTTPGVAVVGTLRDFGGSPSRYLELQAESLRRRGLAAEVFEPEELLDGLGLPGRPRYQLGLRHFTVQEWRGHGIDLSPVRAALDAGVRLIATQTAYMIANKKVLGWLSEGRPWMTERDRATVRRYLPWTRVVADRPVVRHGRTVPLPELLRERQEDFVLKPAVGMSGQQVLVGRSCPPDTWRAAVASAVAGEDHIAQERVDPVPYRMEFARPDGRGSYEAEVTPVFSPFLFDQRDAGCMVRYLPPGRNGVVSIHGHGALPNVAFALR
ncbi:hypothetical protein [Streptomyces sp. WAC06614]|uniref:hypothetical protein n=1 Tax=Streptomyces sp. WAC06614 TaxID=2487416 RepID=UPI00163C0639|nr:hypothetical protein [Streptomyces sp. WAC06614]